MTTQPMPKWSVTQDGNIITLSLGSLDGFQLQVEWEPRAADDGEWIVMTPPDHSFRVHDPVLYLHYSDFADMEGVVDMRIAGPERQDARA